MDIEKRRRLAYIAGGIAVVCALLGSVIKLLLIAGVLS